MNTLIVVFPHQAGAQQGLTVLKKLHAEGIIALYASAVLVKETSGTVSLQSVDEGPSGPPMGASVGGVLGLPVGPVGAALGAAGGATLGALHEMHQEQSHGRLLQQVAQVPPGWSAVVAEFAEFGDARLATRMAGLSGLVLRDVTAESDYLAEVRKFHEARALVDEAWAGYEAAVAEAAATREGHLAEARSRLAGSAPRLKLLDAYTQAQIDARIMQLQQQAEQAGPEHRAELERQIAQTYNDHNQRRAQLEEAWNQAEVALAR